LGLGLPIDLFSDCLNINYTPKILLPNDILMLNEIGETILPTTADSPGAKVAKVGQYIDTYAANCLSPENQNSLKVDLKKIKLEILKNTGKNFLHLNKNQRFNYLTKLDELSKKEAGHYFLQIKYLIKMAYFTSKEGITKAQRYVAIPTEYKGEIKYNSGEKSWAL
jgi:hypothetical protein